MSNKEHALSEEFTFGKIKQSLAHRRQIKAKSKELGLTYKNTSEVKSMHQQAEIFLDTLLEENRAYIEHKLNNLSERKDILYAFDWKREVLSKLHLQLYQELKVAQQMGSVLEDVFHADQLKMIVAAYAIEFFQLLKRGVRFGLSDNEALNAASRAHRVDTTLFGRLNADERFRHRSPFAKKMAIEWGWEYTDEVLLDINRMVEQYSKEDEFKHLSESFIEGYVSKYFSISRESLESATEYIAKARSSKKYRQFKQATVEQVLLQSSVPDLYLDTLKKRIRDLSKDENYEGCAYQELEQIAMTQLSDPIEFRKAYNRMAAYLYSLSLKNLEHNNKKLISGK